MHYTVALCAKNIDSACVPADLKRTDFEIKYERTSSANIRTYTIQIMPTFLTAIICLNSNHKSKSNQPSFLAFSLRHPIPKRHGQ